MNCAAVVWSHTRAHDEQAQKLYPQADLSVLIRAKPHVHNAVPLEQLRQESSENKPCDSFTLCRKKKVTCCPNIAPSSRGILWR
jgi:hypothetical protein